MVSQFSEIFGRRLLRIVKRQLLAVIQREILSIEDVTFVHEIGVLEDLVVVERRLLPIDVEELATRRLVELSLRKFVWFRSGCNAHHRLRNLKVSSWFRYWLHPGLVLNVGLDVDDACCEIVFGVIVGHGYAESAARASSDHKLLL